MAAGVSSSDTILETSAFSLCVTALRRGCGNYRCQYRNFCFVLDGMAASSHALVNLLKLLYVPPGLKFKKFYILPALR